MYWLSSYFKRLGHNIECWCMMIIVPCSRWYYCKCYAIVTCKSSCVCVPHLFTSLHNDNTTRKLNNHLLFRERTYRSTCKRKNLCCIYVHILCVKCIILIFEPDYDIIKSYDTTTNEPVYSHPASFWHTLANHALHIKHLIKYPTYHLYLLISTQKGILERNRYVATL